MIAEPTAVVPESVFENAVLDLIHSILKNAGVGYFVVPKFGFDIGVFVRDASGDYSRFLEVKAYSGGRPDGIGFGTSSGTGPQVNILLSPCLVFVDTSAHWILADSTLPHGSARYAFFSCTAAKAAAMRTVSSGKQNNFRMSALRKAYTDWATLENSVDQFLLRRMPRSSASTVARQEERQ